MKRRHRYMVAASFVSVLILGAFLWQQWPRPRISSETYHGIQSGMMEADVVALVGFPPGNYRHGKTSQLVAAWSMAEGDAFIVHQWLIQQGWNLGEASESFPTPEVSALFPDKTIKVWKTDRQDMFVIFDREGRVRGSYIYSRDMEEPYVQRVRRWCGL